ncbi:MAG: exo-alpha-sialidase [Clostridia bacterium]|nr:exo-alpha-sialidase [Clostridia bacterium]
MIDFEKDTSAGGYTIPQLDLSAVPAGADEKYRELYELVTVDDSLPYLGHPDSVLLKNGDILTVYPSAHGKGAIRSRISRDGGKTYLNADSRQPGSWKNSRETPTVYRLEFSDGTPDKLLLVSGNPRWGNEPTTGGFNFSLSDNEGESWSEFELCFPYLNGEKLCCVVAMASLTRLKEDGKFIDKWMALFHTDPGFVNYKTVLSFENGRPVWSEPEPYFQQYRDIEFASGMCEVECVRSDGGRGDELCLITRSNRKTCNSLLSFSTDEGRTWSEPVFAPGALNGERHKAEYLCDGRLFITFRSIERDPGKVKKYSEREGRGWYSEGWIAWVGTYDDLKNGREGQYRIKIAHTYLPGQTAPGVCANSDVGYCGNVVIDGKTVVTSTYGAFGKLNPDGSLKTYVASKRIDLNLTDELVINI